MMAHIVRAAVLLALTFSTDAYAWSEQGHRAIAVIAEQYLRPAALEQISRMLAADTAAPGGLDFQAASNWAHLHSSREPGTPGRIDATLQWHYAAIQVARPNIPAACFGQKPLPKGQFASEGPAEDCIISKVDQFAAELADRSVPATERLLALKYLINLVGDIHQPLRVADEHSGFGTLVPVSANGMADGDLFTYWERGLVAKLVPDPVATGRRLKSGVSDFNARMWAAGPSHLWALEAHQVAVQEAFSRLGSTNFKGRFVLADEDIAAAEEAILVQLSRAGVRLAWMLNEALAPLPVAEVRIVAPKGSRPAGRTFAMAACSVCHVVAPDQIAPKEFTTAPDFAAIANTRGMNEDALRQFLFGPHPTMPGMSFSGYEANDVIAFILSLKTAAPRR